MIVALSYLIRTIVCALVLGISLLPGDIALAYEEPDYEVVKTFPEFELRQYAPYVVAETVVQGNFTDVGNLAFRRLFAYISEDKRPQGKIAMTTPVIQQPLLKSSETGAEAVQEVDKVNRYRFAFVMPKSYPLESLPVPDNAEVTLEDVPARLMAVRRYSGTWSEDRYRKNEQILFDAIKREGLIIVGEPVFARYNAPFSLWFLRRNEVLIEIQGQSYK